MSKKLPPNDSSPKLRSIHTSSPSLRSTYPSFCDTLEKQEGFDRGCEIFDEEKHEVELQA